MLYQLRIDQQDFVVEIGAMHSDRLHVTVNGTPYTVDIVQDPSLAAPRIEREPPAQKTALITPSKAAIATPQTMPTPATGAVLAPIPGLIVGVSVKVGDEVLAGQTVAVMEAMKMENDLVSQRSGTVLEILVQKGAEVATGDVIMRIGFRSLRRQAMYNSCTGPFIPSP